MTVFSIRKDNFNGTARPWAADIMTGDDVTRVRFKSWCWGFKTKAALQDHIRCVMGPGGREFSFVRGADV